MDILTILMLIRYSKKVGIVGKGLLFDTGGYNIKTAMMELMKFDCGGAAAVFGAARATAALAPEGVEAHFIVAACEVRKT
jgi:leucyl aminopeptidase